MSLSRSRSSSCSSHSNYLTPGRKSDVSLRDIQIQSSRHHQIYQSERIIKESNPNDFEIKDDFHYPDLVVKGVKNKTYRTSGKGLEVTMDKLHEFNFWQLVQRRKFFRVAFIRVMWIPSATLLPGTVKIGIKDLRAKEGMQVVDSREFEAKNMHQYSYQQEIYFHKKELSKLAIFVQLNGYQSKYKDDAILGSIRIYWVMHTTNISTLHEAVESSSSIVEPTRMPILSRLGVDFSRKALTFDSPDSSVSGTDLPLIENPSIEIEKDENEKSDLNTKFYQLKVTSSLNLESDQSSEKLKRALEQIKDPSEMNEVLKKLIENGAVAEAVAEAKDKGKMVFQQPEFSNPKINETNSNDIKASSSGMIATDPGTAKPMKLPW